MADAEVYRRWDDGFVVRRMRPGEAQQVIEWFSVLASMSSDLRVAVEHTREPDADGYYVGELNGKMVSSMVEVPVADDVRYIGCVYVDERHRKSGFARRMIATARDVGDRHNSASVVALDTYPRLESMYEKFDYKTVCKSADYQGKASARVDLSRFGTTLRQVGDAELDRLMRYDDECFIRPGSDWRRKFMSHWLHLAGGRALMAVGPQGDVVGYGCRRPSVNHASNHHIGPLYADTFHIAWDLIHALTDDIVGHTFQLTIMETNEDAVRLVDEMKLKLMLSMIRMSRNGQHETLSSRVFAITSLDVCGF